MIGAAQKERAENEERRFQVIMLPCKGAVYLSCAKHLRGIGTSFLFSLAHAANPGGGTISPAGPTLIGSAMRREREALAVKGSVLTPDQPTIVTASR